MTLGVTVLDSTLASVATSAAASSKTSASFTPPANSKLYLFCWAQSAGSWNFAAPTNSGGLTLNPIYINDSSWGGFGAHDALWEASIDSAPSAMTVTVNASAANAYLTIVVIAVTGSSPRIRNGQTARGQVVSGLTCPVGPLPSAPNSGNLVICFKGANKDTGTDIPKVVDSGFTKLFASSSGGYFDVCGVDTATTYVGGATNFPNTGDSQNDSMSYIVEFEEAVAAAIQTLLAEDGTVIQMEDGTRILLD